MKKHILSLIAVVISVVFIAGVSFLVHSGPKLDFCTDGSNNGIGMWLLGLLCVLAVIVPCFILIRYIQKMKDRRKQVFFSVYLVIAIGIVAYYMAMLLGWSDCPPQI